MKNIGINLNESNQVIAAFDDPTNGDMRIDVNESTYDDIFSELLPYKYDGKLIRDTEKQEYETREREILELKQKLSDTDWILVKISEYRELDLELDKGYTSELEERQVWRDRINELEEEMNPLI